MKNKFWIVLVILFLTAESYLIYHIYSLRRNNHFLKVQIGQLEMTKREFEKFIYNSSTNIFLSDTITLIDKSGSRQSLNQLMLDSDHLFLWISDKHCLDCIEKLLDIVSDTLKSKVFDVKILMTYANGNDFFRLLQSKKITLDAYYVADSNLPLSISNSHVPSVFLLNSKMHVRGLYFISIDNLPGFELYLKSINYDTTRIKDNAKMIQ